MRRVRPALAISVGSLRYDYYIDRWRALAVPKACARPAIAAENDTMARGWESKSIEAQQDEASREQVRKPALTDAQRATAERRATLVLTRARAVADLSRATAPPHRQMLEQAIATIDEQLTQLDG